MAGIPTLAVGPSLVQNQAVDLLKSDLTLVVTTMNFELAAAGADWLIDDPDPNNIQGGPQVRDYPPTSRTPAIRVFIENVRTTRPSAGLGIVRLNYVLVVRLIHESKADASVATDEIDANEVELEAYNIIDACRHVLESSVDGLLPVDGVQMVDYAGIRPFAALHRRTSMVRLLKVVDGRFEITQQAREGYATRRLLGRQAINAGAAHLFVFNEADKTADTGTRGTGTLTFVGDPWVESNVPGAQGALAYTPDDSSIPAELTASTDQDRALEFVFRLDNLVDNATLFSWVGGDQAESFGSLYVLKTTGVVGFVPPGGVVYPEDFGWTVTAGKIVYTLLAYDADGGTLGTGGFTLYWREEDGVEGSYSFDAVNSGSNTPFTFRLRTHSWLGTEHGQHLAIYDSIPSAAHRSRQHTILEL